MKTIICPIVELAETRIRDLTDMFLSASPDIFKIVSVGEPRTGTILSVVDSPLKLLIVEGVSLRGVIIKLLSATGSVLTEIPRLPSYQEQSLVCELSCNSEAGYIRIRIGSSQPFFLVYYKSTVFTGWFFNSLARRSETTTMALLHLENTAGGSTVRMPLAGGKTVCYPVFTVDNEGAYAQGPLPRTYAVDTTSTLVLGSLITLNGKQYVVVHTNHGIVMES